MKVKIDEYELGATLTLTPETVTDTNFLLRLSLNASSERPIIYYSIPKQVERNEEPYCEINIGKRKRNAQTHSVNNNRLCDVQAQQTKRANKAKK